MSSWFQEYRKYLYALGLVTTSTLNAIKDELIKYNIPIRDQFKESFINLAKQQILIAYDFFVTESQNSWRKSRFYQHFQGVSSVRTLETYMEWPAEADSSNRSDMHAEIMTWATKLSNYFDTIKCNSNTMLHIFDKYFIQKDLPFTDAFREYFLSTTFLQITGSYDRFLCTIPENCLPQPNQCDEDASAENKVFVSVSTIQQQMKMTFLAENSSQSADEQILELNEPDCENIGQNTANENDEKMIESHTEVQNSSESNSVRENLDESGDHQMKSADANDRESLDESNFDRESSDGSGDHRMESGDANKFSWLDIGVVGDGPKAIKILNSTQISEESLKRKIHNEIDAENLMNEEKKIQQRKSLALEKYKYNFQELYLNFEPPFKKYLSKHGSGDAVLSKFNQINQPQGPFARKRKHPNGTYSE